MTEENSLEQHQLMARRLVIGLDAIERRILICLVRGMSKRALAALLCVPMDDLERVQASMMNKLNALTTADTVRIGLYAQVDPPNLSVSETDDVCQLKHKGGRNLL